MDEKQDPQKHWRFWVFQVNLGDGCHGIIISLTILEVAKERWVEKGRGKPV